jgi:hypothetical protein
MEGNVSGDGLAVNLGETCYRICRVTFGFSAASLPAFEAPRPRVSGIALNQ